MGVRTEHVKMLTDAITASTPSRDPQYELIRNYFPVTLFEDDLEFSWEDERTLEGVVDTFVLDGDYPEKDYALADVTVLQNLFTLAGVQHYLRQAGVVDGVSDFAHADRFDPMVVEIAGRQVLVNGTHRFLTAFLLGKEHLTARAVVIS